MNDFLKPYLSKKVRVTFRNGHTEEGVILSNPNSPLFPFPYILKYKGQAIAYTPEGRWAIGKTSSLDIISIEPIMKKFTGLAQKHPRIDLSQFVDKVAFIKYNKPPENGKSSYTVAKIKSTEVEFIINDNGYTRSGKRIYDSSVYITEIYDEDAFSVEFKEIPDADPQVEAAKEAVKNLSEEQIAQLLHQLKK